MKFLENDRLADLTAKLTNATIGKGDRFINGRIEVFTMKRAGTDKKYAHALGEKFQHELDFVHTEIAELRKSIGRSVSVGSKVEVSTRAKPTKKGRLRSVSMDAPSAVLPRRVKSCLRLQSETLHVDLNKSPNFNYSNSALGDFQETCTRRLMTDLILTMNISFPDYDFSNVKPSHFVKMPNSNSAINRTNEKLSELAATTAVGNNFLSELWNAINDVIDFSETDVYSYVPPNKYDDGDPLSFLTNTLSEADGTNVVPLWTFNFFFINKSLKRILLFTCVQTMRNDIEATASGDELERGVSFRYHDSASPLAGYVGQENSRIHGLEYDDEYDDEYNNAEDFDMDCMRQMVAAPPLPATVA